MRRLFANIGESYWGGVCWIDGYNNAIHKDFVTTLKTNTDTSNVYFINDPRLKNDKDHRNQPV